MFTSSSLYEKKKDCANKAIMEKMQQHKKAFHLQFLFPLSSFSFLLSRKKLKAFHSFCSTATQTKYAQ
jgi:hypothetical protein